MSGEQQVAAAASDVEQRLAAIVKAYDLRGLYPEEIDESVARAVGAAVVRVLAADGGLERVVVGHDMRASSPSLVAAFADGVAGEGVDVVLVGLVSTDALYFASGRLDAPGAMFTASHNPAQYNGIKLCRAGAAPIGRDTGLAEVRAVASRLGHDPAPARGTVSHQDVLPEYAAHLHALVPGVATMRPLRVVVDAGNGMAGLTAPVVLDRLPVTVDPLYFELDGSFPHHDANPIDPTTLVDLQRRVVETGADLGLAFDGDADRCFVVDEQGGLVDPSTLTALIAARALEREPGSTVIHNLITSRAVPEIVTELGGTPVRTRVGHSFIKQVMAETGAVFGGEHSGHFYFRDFWRADSGMLAALHVLAALGGTPDGTSVSSMLAPYRRYVMSGEINTAVADQAAATTAVEAVFAARPGTTADHLDGLTVTAPAWWLNVRPSNTEPLLRLNVEGVDEATMVAVRDEALALIRAHAV